MKVLHIVGGSNTNGAFKGANILHNALLNLKINSRLLNDTPPKENKEVINNQKLNIIYINNVFPKNLIKFFFVLFEKFLKSIYLKSPRSTFTLGLFGFDITKLKEYKEADIIHIHWLNQGFINIKSISKINKPIVWTMRDMWPFTGGSHYLMDFEEYEKGYLSKKIKDLKKKFYVPNIHFVAISNWLKKAAEKSDVLKDHKIKTIYNNINLDDFKLIKKSEAKSSLKIFTKKKILLFGAQNPQSKRKGWEILTETLKKIDKSKFYLLIYGNFWSNKILDKIGIEYKSIGFIDDKQILNKIYCSADIFLALSLQEAFGKTWAEAMACNIPVICFDNTSISEIIDHKVNGFIVDKEDPEKLIKGIEWLISKENILNRENIRKKIHQFNPKLIADQYVELYNKILS